MWLCGMMRIRMRSFRGSFGLMADAEVASREEDGEAGDENRNALLGGGQHEGVGIWERNRSPQSSCLHPGNFARMFMNYWA